MNRTKWIVGGAAVVVVLLVAFAVFRPDKLVVDQRVDDELDAGVAAALEQATGDTTTEPPAGGDGAEAGGEPDAGEPPPSTAGPVVTATGGFGSHNSYTVTGTAAVVTQPDGSRQLVLQELMSDNGPDLQLYLSPVTGGGVDGGVKLGPLRGNIGTQAYDLPADLDLESLPTVVIWCERFSRAFGSATLA